MNWVPMITLLNLYLVLPRIMDMSKTREESKCEDLFSWIHFSYFELSFSFSFTHSFGTFAESISLSSRVKSQARLVTMRKIFLPFVLCIDVSPSRLLPS